MMSRKSMLKYMVSTIAVVSFSSTVQAEHHFHTPYIGIEAIQTNQNFAVDYGKNIFYKNPQNYGVLAGIKFYQGLGVEVGYEFQPKQTQDYTVFAGQQEPGGSPLIGNESEAGTAAYKAKHPYIGLTAEYRSDFNVGKGKLKLQALIGASATRVTAYNTRLVVDGTIQVPPDVHTYSRRRLVPMARVAAYCNLTSDLIFGLSVHYRNMSKFKIISAQVEPTYTIKMKDAIGIGAAFIYQFKF